MIESASLADAPTCRAIVEGMPESVIVVDPAGVVRLWNAAAERLFGFTAAEALGATLDLIVPQRFKAAHDAGFARAVASGQLRVAGRVLRTRANHKEEGRKVYVDFTFSLLKAEDGSVRGVYAVARDATEAHLKEQAARALAK